MKLNKPNMAAIFILKRSRWFLSLFFFSLHDKTFISFEECNETQTAGATITERKTFNKNLIGARNQNVILYFKMKIKRTRF